MPRAGPAAVGFFRAGPAAVGFFAGSFATRLGGTCVAKVICIHRCLEAEHPWAGQNTVNPIILACIPLAAGSLSLVGLGVGGGE